MSRGRCPPPSSRTAPRWPASGKRELTALCTSHPAVRQWMSDALAHVFRQVPDLAGVYTITASENLTNCASHGDWRSCQRCKDAQRRGNHRRGHCRDRRGRPPRQPQGQRHRVRLGLAGPRRCPGHHRAVAEIGLADVGQRMGHADRARRDQDQSRRILDLRGRTGAAGRAALGGRQASRAEDGGRDPVQQHLRNRQRSLSPRHGPRGRALPQPGAGQA